jgi:hypothetical protein
MSWGKYFWPWKNNNAPWRWVVERNLLRDAQWSHYEQWFQLQNQLNLKPGRVLTHTLGHSVCFCYPISCVTGVPNYNTSVESNLDIQSCVKANITVTLSVYCVIIERASPHRTIMSRSRWGSVWYSRVPRIPQFASFLSPWFLHILDKYYLFLFHPLGLQIYPSVV